MTNLSPSPAVGTLPEPSARATSARPSPVRELLTRSRRPGIVSFGGGLPASELFDLEGLQAAFREALQNPANLQYSASEGDAQLRGVIAERYRASGLDTPDSTVMITTGSQQALWLLAVGLVDPGDTVLVEEPCYLAALQSFELAGARIVGVPVVDGQLDVEALERLAAEHRPKFLYTVPTFQNPTGLTYSASTRQGIATAAVQHGFRVIEDDPYRKLRYDGEPVPSITDLAPEHTINVGSMSKAIAPGLRTGWMRLPDDIRRAVHVAKQATDLHTSGIDQAALALYITSGRDNEALVPIRAEYTRRRDAMLEAVAASFPEGSTWTRPEGGMFVWVRLPEGRSSIELLPRALDAGVAYVPGEMFYCGHPDARTLRLSFTNHSATTIHEAIGRLGTALHAE